MSKSKTLKSDDTTTASRMLPNDSALQSNDMIRSRSTKQGSELSIQEDATAKTFQ